MKKSNTLFKPLLTLLLTISLALNPVCISTVYAEDTDLYYSEQEPVELAENELSSEDTLLGEVYIEEPSSEIIDLSIAESASEPEVFPEAYSIESRAAVSNYTPVSGSLSDCNLNNFSNWRSGQYSMTTGNYEPFTSRICLNSYKTVSGNEKYTVSLSDYSFRVLIREFDQNNSFVKSCSLGSGDAYIPSSVTTYIGISIYCCDSSKTFTFNQYEQLFNTGFNISISYSTSCEAFGASDLNNFANWRSGQYNMNTGMYSVCASRICLNTYKSVSHNDVYTITISDKNYHLLIRELDSEYKLIQNYNLGSGDRYSPSFNAVYVGISLYNTKTSAISYDQYRALFESGFSVTLSAPNINYSDLATCDLNNFANWRLGQYSLNDGLYQAYSSRICLTDYKGVTPGEKYYIYISDPTLHIVAREIAANGSLIKSYDLKNKSTYTVDQNVAYVGICLYTTRPVAYTYDSYKTLFEKGLQLEMSTSEHTTPASKPEGSFEALENCNLSALDNWKSGIYNYSNGKLIANNATICLSEYKKVTPQTTYDIAISDLQYKVSIIELDTNMNKISNYDFQDRNSYTSSANAAYIAISIYNRYGFPTSYNDYMTLFNGGFSLNIRKHTVEPTDGSYVPTSVYDAVRHLICTLDPHVMNVSQFRMTIDEYNSKLIPDTIDKYFFELSTLRKTTIHPTTKGNYISTVSLTDIANNAGYFERLDRARASLDEVLNQADYKMTDLDKVVLAHEYIVSHTYYWDDNNLCFCAGGPLGEGYGVCQGYAYAMNLILDYLEIDNDFAKSTSMDHGWSYVKIDGNWYHVDPTWDDTLAGDTEKTRHRFLVRNDNEFTNIYANKNHYGWVVNTPASNSTKYTNWFVHDIAGEMFYFDGCWYYRDQTNNSIMKANINTNDIQTYKSFDYNTNLQLGGIRRSIVNGVQKAELYYYINGTEIIEKLN